MEGIPAIYLGRPISKKNFRVFIYSPDGQEMLVNSWNEYEKHMASGLWFATKQEAENASVLAVIAESKAKRLKKGQVKKEEVAAEH